jgi:hypothetical protein
MNPHTILSKQATDQKPAAKKLNSMFAAKLQRKHQPMQI